MSELPRQSKWAHPSADNQPTVDQVHDGEAAIRADQTRLIAAWLDARADLFGESPVGKAIRHQAKLLCAEFDGEASTR